MSTARSLAAAQTVPKRGDVETNLEQHRWLAQAASLEGVGLLVFPELSLTGYELDLARELAFTEGDGRLGPLIELARAEDMTIVAGAPVRVGTGHHIGSFVFAPDRSVQLYTKRHLGAFGAGANPGGRVPPAEGTVFEPGECDPLVRFQKRTGALAVCADTAQASHPERAAQRGARFYLASMFIVPSELEKEAARFKTYAARHSMAVVMANYGGPTGGLASGAASAIWSEQGELVTRLEDAGCGLAIARQDEKGWRGKQVALGE